MGSPGTATTAARAPDDPPPSTPRRSGELGDRHLVLVVGVVTLPILWMGYGTDIDVTDVLQAADSIGRGDYAPSRAPGVPVFELIAAALDPIGGHLLVNLATAGAAAACVVGVARLVRTWGHDNGDLIALAFLASPMTVVASSSTGDFIWALAFFVWATLAHLRDRTLLAGVLFALAIGSRMSTGILVAALILADGWEPAHRRRCVRSALVAAPLAAIAYVPSWFAYGKSWDMLDTAQGFRSITNNLGRFLYKNYANAGVLALVLVLMALPALVAALRRWADTPMLRFAVLAFLGAEGLFFMLPWKGAHLLPALLALVLWLGTTRRNERRFLWVLVAALTVNGLVSFRPLTPDDPGAAQSARWDPAISVGLLVNDIDCRLEAMREPLQPLNGNAWPCSLKPMRGPGDADGESGP